MTTNYQLDFKNIDSNDFVSMNHICCINSFNFKIFSNFDTFLIFYTCRLLFVCLIRHFILLDGSATNSVT